MNSEDQPNVEEVLEVAMEKVRGMQEAQGFEGVAAALPEIDGALWEMGQSFIRSRWKGREAEPHAGDVYVASQLYSEGGHTALIGDFVDALAENGEGPDPSLIVTNIHGQHEGGLDEVIQRRTRISVGRTRILMEGGLSKRLESLADELERLRPRRTFLFQHPEDPLVPALAHAELAPLRMLVHHADATPSLGLSIPGLRIIDLNPVAAARSRLQGLHSELLLLTAPDPGSRPVPFLANGRLVTATCGSPHKYPEDYRFGYAGTVAEILKETEGRHVHIGPLKRKRLERIRETLEREGVDPSQFVHVSRVDSLSRGLWENQCDVYLASFPIDGARASVEVAASGTPYLSHRKRKGPSIPDDELTLAGRMAWSDWGQLREVLRSLKSEHVLSNKSALVRRSYESLYSPAVFRETLSRIVRGEGGVVDPHVETRSQHLSRGLEESVNKASESLLGGAGE